MKWTQGLKSQTFFRRGSWVFETLVAFLFLIPKTARLGARLVILWMTAIILSHIFVLGYGLFFVDALVLTLLAARYFFLTPGQPRWGEPRILATSAAPPTPNTPLPTHYK